MQVGNAPLLSGPVLRADGKPRSAGEELQKPNPSAAAPAAAGSSSADSARIARQAREQQVALNELSSRERAVRAAQTAQAALAGQYAGQPVYTFTRGPDGQAYAVSGDVPIDVSPIPNDPEATLRKMQVVLQAALAGGGDAGVAAQARAIAAQAQAELAEAKRQEEQKADDERQDSQQKAEREEKPDVPRQNPAIASSLDLYRVLDALQTTRSLISERA